MKTRHFFKQPESLEQRLAKTAKALLEKAASLPPGAERDELTRKARETEVASHMNEWLSSPGVVPPKD